LPRTATSRSIAAQALGLPPPPKLMAMADDLIE